MNRESAGTCVPSDQMSSPNTATTAPPGPVPAMLPRARASDATCAPTLFITASARMPSIWEPFRRAPASASLLAIWARMPFSASSSLTRSAASNTSATGEPG